MAVPLLIVCIPLGYLLARSRRVPVLVPWVLPVGLGVLFFVAWRSETTWTGGGDPQPGTVALVGTVSVVLVLLAMFLGYHTRYRAPRDTRR
jgi:hypothetical protein